MTSHQVREAILLRDHLDQACSHIEHLLPFLNEKAKGSGDVAGIRANALQFISSAFVVKQRTMNGKSK